MTTSSSSSSSTSTTTDLPQAKPPAISYLKTWGGVSFLLANYACALGTLLTPLTTQNPLSHPPSSQRSSPPSTPVHRNTFPWRSRPSSSSVRTSTSTATQSTVRASALRGRASTCYWRGGGSRRLCRNGVRGGDTGDDDGALCGSAGEWGYGVCVREEE